MRYYVIDVDLWVIPYLQASLNNSAKTEDSMSYTNQSCPAKINQVPGYKRFRRIIAYLEKRSQSVNNLSQVVFSLFPEENKNSQQVLYELIHLMREIPYLFLSAIDADIEHIMALCGEDLKEFERNKERTDLYPQSVTLRYMPAVYQVRTFPFRMDEDKAVQYAIEHYCRNRFRCAINYPEFKTIYIEPDGKVDTVFYPPEIQDDTFSIIPSPDGREEGRMHIVD